jgi:glucan biosynthesis protein C
LLIIALVSLPLFLLLKRESGQKVISWLAKVCSWPGVILLLVIPIIVVERLIGVFNPLYFLIFFIYGYLILADDRFERAIDRHKGVALVVGLLLLILFVAWADFDLFEFPIWLAESIRLTLMSWFMIIAILGYGKKYLNSPPKRKSSRFILGYFGEGSYPFYILHQTVIVVIAFFVVQWAGGAPAKYLIIAGGAYLGTIVIYDLLVRRWNVTRFLIGMRSLKRKPLEEPAPRPVETAA